MLDDLLLVALLGATATTGLMAGIFFTFTNSVLPGLGRCDDRTLVLAMQRINVAILNGWFLALFLGAFALPAAAAGLALAADEADVLGWALAALLLYGATLAITFRVNVPLNDGLLAAGDPDQRSDLAAVRQQFEAPWVRWNLVRTVSCTAAFGCLGWALVLVGRG